MKLFKVIQCQLVSKVEVFEITVRARNGAEARENARIGKHVVKSEGIDVLEGSETFGESGYGFGLNAEDDALNDMEDAEAGIAGRDGGE